MAVVFGTDGNDFFHLAGDGRTAPPGYTDIVFNPGDLLAGLGGDDILIGTNAGNRYGGYDGYDTLDYSGFDQGVILDEQTGGIYTLGGALIGTFAATSGVEEFLGSAFNDVMESAIGGGGAATWRGRGGNDLLIAGADAETLDGGADSDTVSYTNSAAGVTVDLALPGPQVSAGAASGDTLTGIENLIGSSLNDKLSGDGGNNVLTGGAGADQLIGRDGVDTSDYSASAAGVTVDLALGTGVGGDAEGDTLSGIENAVGSKFDDLLTGTGTAIGTLSGGDGNDVLRGAGVINGEAGNDTLFGGAAIETLNGGADNDTVSYIGSAAGVTVNLGLLLPQISAGDASGDLLLGVENLIGSAHADSLTGDANANILNGQGNADTMAGGAGDDLFYVNNGRDMIVEATGEGYDTVAVNVSYVLAAGAEVEDLHTTNSTSTRAIDLTGNAFANSLTGNAGDNELAGGAGNDTLNGGSGNDTMRGGADDDTYFVDDAGDVVIELHGEGRDMIFARTSHVLAAGSEVEEMRTTKLAGLDAIDFSGNEFNNRLLGNAGVNAQDGGSGADRLNGWTGNDILTGGTGMDTFVFSAALDATNNVDTITDFSGAADSIWLEGSVFSALAAGALAVTAFAANASGLAADADDRIVYDTDSGALFYDADGIGGANAGQFAVLTGAPTITAADFEVI